MKYLPILPEMLEAGRAALTEARQKELTDLQMLIDVYMAMEGTKIILALRERHGAVIH